MKKGGQIGIFSDNKPSFELVKKQIDTLSTDRVAKLGLRTSFLSMGLSFLILALAWAKLPPEVPLLYSRPYGQSQLMPAWGLWLLPGLGLLINIVSIRWAGVVFETEKLLAQILIWVGGLTALMAMAAVIKVVLLML